MIYSLGILLAGGIALSVYAYHLCQPSREDAPPKRTLVSEKDNAQKWCASPWLFSPDSKLLVTSTASRKTEAALDLWNVETGERKATVALPQQVQSLSFNERGDVLAVATGGPWQSAGSGKPREVRLLSFPDLKETKKVESRQYVSAALLSPNGRLLALLKHDESKPMELPHELSIWEVESQQRKYGVEDFRARGTFVVRFSPDGRRIAHTDYAPPLAPDSKDLRRDKLAIREYEAETGKVLQTLYDPPKGPYLVNFEYSADGDRFFINNGDGVSQYTFKDAEYQLVCDYKAEKKKIGTIRHLLVSRDGKWLVMGFDGKYLGPRALTPTVIIWDLAGAKESCRWKVDGLTPQMSYLPIGAMALSPDKKTLAVGGNGLHLYDLSDKLKPAAKE